MFEKITPEEAGISSRDVTRFIDYLEENSQQTHALLLVRDGKIFTEAYWKPFHKDFCHRQYSQTKSFVGIAVGLLVEDGLVSLDDKIVDLFPEKIDNIDALDERIKRQTVRQMLTMRTVGCSKSWFTQTDPDRTHIYFGERDVTRIPGTVWKYDSPGSQVLAALVEKLTGKSLFEYLNEKLFRHMGSFKTARILKTPNGDSWGDSAMLCTARDMASFAQLLTDGGRWEGKQLIDEGYVREATSALVDNSDDNYGDRFGCGYGYQIWRAPRDGFAFVGMGGQITVSFPSRRLIFVINSDTQGLVGAYNVMINGLLTHIVDKLSDEPLAPDGEAVSALEERISALELFSLKGRESAPIRDKIDGKTFVCEENALGMTKFSFKFEGDGGEFVYTNAQGDKVIPFGINKNAFGKFPELGYADEYGRVVTENGHMYNDAVSLRFTEDEKLQMRVQIIDKYFGNLLATFAFSGDEVWCRFSATAEYFLLEYRGEFAAKMQ